MCGITGIFDIGGSNAISRELLHRMNEAQFHRGPDEGGLHLEPGLGLGHRRLSIIDLASGQQPLFNEDGSVVVVFNGEIYNFQQLVPELEALGHVFRTHSDTEVIVHAWEAWGETCVRRFRGMFAFALWDRNRETLFVVRDRFGVKPLYYAFLDTGEFIFGSELKALLVHPSLARDIDPLAVEEYFAYGYVPEPRTIFKRVQKLPPGFTLTLRRGAARALPKQYWDVPFEPVPVKDEAAAMDELVERLKESIRLRMIADVPLGAFLSGGVDSSAVVAMMATQSPTPVNTCSIGFDDPAFDEVAFAQQVADRYRTRHHVETVAADDFSLVGKLAQVYDEPYADSSALPTYRVCELARKHVKVALSGDGGDEHFAGYRRYRWFRYEERMRSVMPLMLRRPLFGALGRLYPKADWAPRVFRAKTTFEALARDTVEGYFHGVSLLSDAQRRQLFSPAFKRELQGYEAVEVLRRHAAVAPTDDPLSLVQYLDMKTYLVGDILTKVDRASMAHALEVREPLLDHELMGWVSGLPTDLKLRGTEGKYLLKKAMEPYLPHDVLYRRKMGFSVPLAAWFRGPLAATIRSVVLGERLASTGLFNRDYLREVVDAHQSGRRDCSVILWTVLMFDAFLGQVLGMDEAQREAA
ncbi:XrtA/PEP-CTERM system amidotransferase [Thiobacillus sedimenti]|uniref:asparagine synthase (glutamine-hydrolyzing) n=1 Tax=Thiobacillus sedimenti TaxID=3110231 RepID=A0ABZ1CK55_9PROT|nr:XrtA/PEP-CTERM system amidotransferase [Thiobacillus sp. SCUT-2]WRS39621.1 XrtA/PEP-CTERM system amidotransferase [Thiobacillus sp. SCUT-2]